MYYSTRCFMEELESTGRSLVNAQIKIEEMKNELQNLTQYELATPVKSKLYVHPGEEKKLKIVSPLYPPKIQVSAEKHYKPYQLHVQKGTESIWGSTIYKLYRDYEDQCAKFKDLEKAIIWVTYYYPNEHNYNVNNMNTKVIIYALSEIIPCTENNRAITIITSGKTDKDRPRTEIIIAEDVGQLDGLKDFPGQSIIDESANSVPSRSKGTKWIDDLDEEVIAEFDEDEEVIALFDEDELDV